MLNPPNSTKVRKSRRAWQKMQRKITRQKLLRKLHLDQLALDLAEEWTGVAQGFRQHLYVE